MSSIIMNHCSFVTYSVVLVRCMTQVSNMDTFNELRRSIQWEKHIDISKHKMRNDNEQNKENKYTAANKRTKRDTGVTNKKPNRGISKGPFI